MAPRSRTHFGECSGDHMNSQTVNADLSYTKCLKRAFSIREFCQFYELGRTKAYQEINAGRLKAVKVGSKTIIRADDAEEWLANLKVAHAA
jgi:excisionase family DNA binding protein